jgi:hypothetical protein
VQPGELVEAMPPGEEHHWPSELTSGRLGVFGGPRRLPVLLVRPQLVVKISADSAFRILEAGYPFHYQPTGGT